MPHITIEGPTITSVDVKRQMVEEMTASAARAYGLPEQIMVVVIKENKPENVGVGGQLILDRQHGGEME